jgi:hypothetical protein
MLSETEDDDFEKIDIELNFSDDGNVNNSGNDDCDEDYKYNLDSPNASGLTTVSSLSSASKNNSIFSRGYKGRLTTHHFNSNRRVKHTREDWLLSFESTMVRNNVNPHEILKSYEKAIEDDDMKSTDAILVNMINFYKLPERIIKTLFRIGNSRIARLKRNVDIQASNVVSQEELDVLQEFMESLPIEEGYPCSHRRLKKYILIEEDKLNRNKKERKEWS